MNLHQIPLTDLLAEIARRAGEREIRIAEASASRIVSWAEYALDQVAASEGILVEELLSAESRSARSAAARHLAVYVLRQATGRSFAEIADIWDQHYASAMHAHRKVAQKIDIDPVFANRARHLVSQVIVHRLRRSSRQAVGRDKATAAPSPRK